MYKLKTANWHITRIVFLLAGVISLLSLFLTYFTNNNYWLLLTLFVSLMEINFSLTGYCPSAIVLDKLGFSRE